MEQKTKYEIRLPLFKGIMQEKGLPNFRNILRVYILIIFVIRSQYSGLQQVYT